MLPHTLDRASSFKFTGSISGTALFEALRAARKQRGEADWFMIGDDDTHVDPEAVDSFVRAASPSLVYGNLFHNVSGRGNPKPWCHSTHGSAFRLQFSWFTGGSGLLIPGSVVNMLTANVSNAITWAWASGSCKCFDVPLACALTDLGVGFSHQPTLFLDSCLSCADWLPTAERRILACHAVSAFRSYNVHAKRKARRDREYVRDHFAIRSPRGYHWPSNLSHVEPIDRMDELRSNLCAPRPPTHANTAIIAKTSTLGRRLHAQHTSRVQATARLVQSLGTLHATTLNPDIQAALGGRCGLTTWSRDGFGHQLAAALSCEAWAMANASYIYVRSNHTALEHRPSNASTLLGWLNRHTGSAAEQHQPLSVPEAKYHSNCPKKVSPSGDLVLPACSPGIITVCDNCFGFVAPERAEQLQIRKRLAAKLQQSVAASFDHGEACQSRRSHVCIHLRGQGDPGPRTTKDVTSMFAERDAARQRQKRFPAAWWHRALTAAAGALGSAAPRSPEALLVSVHTNSKALASTIFGNLSRLADGTPIQLRTFDESFPLLQLLHELLFCCDALVTSDSSLSWVASLGTRAVVVASTPSESHIGFHHQGIVVPRS